MIGMFAVPCGRRIEHGPGRKAVSLQTYSTCIWIYADAIVVVTDEVGVSVEAVVRSFPLYSFPHIS